MRWTTSTVCPEDWGVRLQACHGGVHHSPLGLELTAEAGGEPVFASLEGEEQPLAIAIGTRHRCRFSAFPRHLTFSSLPAFHESVENRDDALQDLVRHLASQGAADVFFPARAATWTPGESIPRTRWGPILEYVVSLTSNVDDLMMNMRKTYRKLIRHGERQGWQLKTAEGDDAATLLQKVRMLASERAYQRGGGFVPGAPPGFIRSSVSDLRTLWGARTYVATDGTQLLGVWLVGWGGTRAFGHLGGSTEEGYRCDAAQWAQWRIMCDLVHAGFSEYNLGSTHHGAEDPIHPDHGLYKFKTGFGARVIDCRGAEWTGLRPAHQILHRMTRLGRRFVHPAEEF